MSGNQSKSGEKNTCLFCNSMDGELHSASTFSIDHTVRQYAIKLKDTYFLRKIAGGDLVAIEASITILYDYKLFHDARDAQKSSEETDISSFHGIALAELIALTKPAVRRPYYCRTDKYSFRPIYSDFHSSCLPPCGIR